MPLARFKGVFLCSSEDKNYPATNLINNSNKKWRIEETGLDSAYVVLQLENSMKITGIDIGNENSTFIEVSVGRPGWPIEKYKTILINSSFMTIPDSRVSENPNRVRCFAKDALIPDVANEKWELVKILCTQPFNKHVQFGISFIKVHVADTVNVSSPANVARSPLFTNSPKEKKSCDEALGLPKNSVFAKFRMREDSSDSDKETAEASALFSKWKEEKESPKKESTTLSAAAAIRDASTSISKLQECTKINKKIDTPPAKSRRSIESDKNDDTKKQQLDRYRSAIMYDDDDENTSNPRLEKLINDDKERIERERKAQIDSKKAKKDISREDTVKKKIESSADKFKVFLEKDNLDSSSSDQSNQSKGSGADQAQIDVDDDLGKVKTQTPAKVNVPDSPQASTAQSPNPPAWKVKNKRPATANEGSASKRHKSVSPEPISSDDDTGGDLLKGVVFVISGIQNPDRAEIRGRGLELGAKYRPDWDDSCTHLICAFKNTPKYKQVEGTGIIVNKKWINDCYTRKKKLPWQDYQL